MDHLFPMIAIAVSSAIVSAAVAWLLLKSRATPETYPSLVSTLSIAALSALAVAVVSALLLPPLGMAASGNVIAPAVAVSIFATFNAVRLSDGP